MEDEKIAGKISDGEKQSIIDKCSETIKWLDSNQLAEKEEYEDRQKQLEAIANPIITKLYQGSGGAPNAGADSNASAGGASGGPTIEEVD